MSGLTQEEAFARIRLLRCPNVGPVSYRQLLARFGTARAALDALPDLAARRGGRYQVVGEARIAAEVAAVRAAGARYLFHDSADYPALLAELDSAPPILTCRGEAALAARPCVALVGARNASAAALKLAREFAAGLAGAGWVFLIGLPISALWAVAGPATMALITRQVPANEQGRIQGSLGSLGTDGDFSFGYAPRAATSAYLTVTANAGGFCGGAHPYGDYWWLTFDRKTGRKVDLGTWLTPAAVPRGDWFEDSALRPLSPAFRGMVMRRLRFEDRECREVVNQAEYWAIGLDRSGLVFSPSLPHVAKACGDDAAVPFAELAKWLSPAGKARAARQKGG